MLISRARCVLSHGLNLAMASEPCESSEPLTALSSGSDSATCYRMQTYQSFDWDPESGKSVYHAPVSRSLAAAQQQDTSCCSAACCCSASCQVTSCVRHRCSSTSAQPLDCSVMMAQARHDGRTRHNRRLHECLCGGVLGRRTCAAAHTVNTQHMQR